MPKVCFFFVVVFFKVLTNSIFPRCVKVKIKIENKKKSYKTLRAIFANISPGNDYKYADLGLNTDKNLNIPLLMVLSPHTVNTIIFNRNKSLHLI